MATRETLPNTIEEFISGKVIPDVVEDLAGKALAMRVTYGELEVGNGLRLRVTHTQSAPHVEFRDRDFGDHLYTLLMVDPDAPSPQNPSFRDFLHWAVINIPGTIPPTQSTVINPHDHRPCSMISSLHECTPVFRCPRNCDVEIREQGEEVLSYLGPGPPEGQHRYVFLAYRQPGRLEDIRRPAARKNFELKAFTRKYKLGLPVAGVYFLAKYGDELDFPAR